jgi:hypothetical protein
MTASVSKVAETEFQCVLQACPAELQQLTPGSFLQQLLNELQVVFFNLALFHTRVEQVCRVLRQYGQESVWVCCESKQQEIAIHS